MDNIIQPSCNFDFSPLKLLLPSPIQNYYFSLSPSIPIPYYNFYKYNNSSKNYNEINYISGTPVNCNAFDNWKCVSGDEIIKYKIRIDGE
jgi:hypothetical protein